MPGLAIAWTFLKGLPWKYIGIALAVLSAVLLVWRAPWAEHRQKTKDQVLIAAEKARGDGYLANQIKLTAALNQQNAAVDALRKEGDQRKADGAKALQQAQRENKGLSDQAEALRRSAKLKPGKDDPCVISETLVKVGSI